MNTKAIIAILGVIIIGAGIYFYLDRNTSVLERESANAKSFSWEITDLGPGPGSDAPRAGIVLVVDGAKRAIGEYDGNCAEIRGTNWQLLEGEETGVICWWAGGGSEIGVFKQNGQYVVREGQLDEGSAEVAGTRGNFKDLFTI